MKVTVLLPVGPHYNKEWLEEAVDSVKNQTYQINELLIVDDGANLDSEQLHHEYHGAVFYANGKRSYRVHLDKIEYISYWKNPCNLGFSSSFNVGMAVASNDLVVFLAHDDKLMPECVESFVGSYIYNEEQDGWYASTYIDSNGTTCDIPNNLSMITKGLWKSLGGIPPAGFVGPDALLLSCLIKHAPDKIIKVRPGEPLYWIREHDLQETKIHTWRFVDEMNSIRDKITKDFKFNE